MSNLIIVTVEFDAGHRVPLHKSKCRHPHGHRYKAEFSITSDILSEEGFVWDFGEAKKAIKEWVDRNFDHNMIYQEGDTLMEQMKFAYEACMRADQNIIKPWFKMIKPPTCENMAEVLFRAVVEILEKKSRPNKIRDRNIKLSSIRLWETPGNSAVCTSAITPLKSDKADASEESAEL